MHLSSLARSAGLLWVYTRPLASHTADYGTQRSAAISDILPAVVSGGQRPTTVQMTA